MDSRDSERANQGMRKIPAVVIHALDFPVFLMARIGQTPVREFARKLGVSHKLVYMLLNGQRTPSGGILKKLRLEIYYGLKSAARDKKA
jgi:transcriptional regulator with XRE-family HTH domain